MLFGSLKRRSALRNDFMVDVRAETTAIQISREPPGSLMCFRGFWTGLHAWQVWAS